MKKLFLILAILFVTCSSAFAAVIPFTSVQGGGGGYSGTLIPLNDGIWPNEGQQWQTQTTWWNGTATYFTFDMGAAHLVEDLLLSVDNNDAYKVSFSLDNTNWTELFSIAVHDGEISWGMDTFNTAAGSAEYDADVDFIPVVAQYLKIQAIGGDNMYSVGEFQVNGTPTPIPGAVWLLGSGLVGLMGMRRKFKA